MSRPIDDTLTPRNNADFPVVSGPVGLRVYNAVSDLPAPGTFPEGTHVYVRTPTPAQYVTTGTAWQTTGGQAYAPAKTADWGGSTPATIAAALDQLAAGGNRLHVYVSNFAGADLGAQINAADAFIGASSGIIEIPDGDYTVSTQIVLSAGRWLKFGKGTYTNNVNGPFCLYRDYTRISGRGWGTIILESSINVQTGHIIFEPYLDTLASHANGGFGNVIIEDLQLAGAAPTFDSVTSAISLGNSINTHVNRVFFNATKTIGVNVGGSSLGGHFSDNTWITNCLFINVASQNIGVVNSKHVHVLGNTLLASGQIGSPGAAYIDFEPNVSTDVLEGFEIIGNVIDARTSPNPGSDGIIVQSADALITGPGVVANNTIIGGSIDGTITNDISIGIYLIGVRDVLVIGNDVRRTGQAGITVDNGAVPSLRCTVSNNRLHSVGGGGSNAMNIGGTYHVVTDNKIYAPSGQGSNNYQIVEFASADHNVYINNFIDGPASNSIVLVGAHSRRVLNHFTFDTTQTTTDAMLTYAGPAATVASITWTAPALLNSWVNFGLPYSSVGYYKNPMGRVYLRGVVASGTSSTAVIFNLPAGYRPAATRQFTTQSNGSPVAINVSATGDVVVAAGGSTVSVMLDGVSFEAEQ